MKIVFIIPSLNVGGAETQLTILSNYLNSLGIDVSIIYRCNGPLIKKLNKGIELYKIYDLPNINPISFFQILYLLRKINPDVVQTFLPQMDILGGMSSIILKKKYIISERTSSVFYKNTLYYKIRKKIGENGVVLCNSKSGLKYWSKNGLSNNKNYFIPNSISNNLFLDKEKKSFNKKLKIVCAGRIINSKGFDLVIKAIDILKYENLELSIIGEGEYKNSLISLTEKLKLQDKIFFKGFVPNISKIFKKYDLFISMSQYEGMPNTVMEAAASRCALILSDINEHKNIFNNKSAIFCKKNDVKLLSEKIKCFIKNKNELKKISENANKVSKLYAESLILPMFVKFYNKILS